VERDHLDRVYPLAAGYHAVRMNADGEMAVLTGQAQRTPRPPSWPSASIRASTVPRYWIVCRIAGASPGPKLRSLGSLGALGCRWRPGLRDRCARSSVRLATTGLSAFCASPNRLRSRPRRSRTGVCAETSRSRVGLQPHSQHTPRDSDHLKTFAATSTAAAPRARPSRHGR